VTFSVWITDLHKDRVLRVRKPLLLLLIITSAALGQHAGSSKRSEPIPIFALLGSEKDDSISIDPMMFIDGTRIRSVPDPCTESSALQEFQSRYLKSGSVYPVIFGGVQQGTAMVTKLEGEEWLVHLDSGAPIHDLTMALAVGSSGLGRSRGLRRSPTMGEQEHIAKLAAEIFRKRGASVSSLARIRIDQAAAIEIDHSLKLISSVEIETADQSGMEYSLFFVAEPGLSKESIIWFQHPMSEVNAEAVYLIDYLARDGARPGRLVVRRVFYENYRYEVYALRGGKWTKEFASEIFGCL